MRRSTRCPLRGLALRQTDHAAIVRDETFLDAFIDAFTPPDDLMLTQPDNGFMARIRDGHRIGAYFRDAVTELGLENRAQQ